MFEVAEHFCLAPYIIYNAVDFFLQNANKYISSKGEIQLFAIVSMWFLSRLHLDNEKTMEDYCMMCLNIYNIDQMAEKILEVIDGENCNPKFDKIYKYLPSRGSLVAAKEFMCKSEEYLTLGPSNTALGILGPEFFDKILDRTPKVFYKYYVEIHKNIKR